MFGYLAARREFLPEEQAKRYKDCYCGLCMCLKERRGQLSRMTLNFDLCFLVLLLGSLYEPEERQGESRCPVHPLKPQSWWQSEFTAYAADMNVLLAYLKCRDDWNDDSSFAALAASGALKKSYIEIARQYPRQNAAVTESLENLAGIERENIEDADAAAASFGRLMAELMVYKEDRWSGTLRAMGNALGEFIYVMDAVMDLSSDTVRDSYNPFRRYYGLDNEERFRDILKMLLSECVLYFDRLPLVKDADILKNILCFGLWQQFEKKFPSKEGSSDVSGSI
ncbi:MAG: DUF5685 family protein [Candidatus Limivicinus sp.]|jgi:hypothetical protein